MKVALTSLLGLCCLLMLLATPSEAADASSSAVVAPYAESTPVASIAGQSLSPLDNAIFLTCFLQLECDDSSVISCSGNSCQTTNGDHCAQCDGVTAGCCAHPCCEICQDNLDD